MLFCLCIFFFFEKVNIFTLNIYFQFEYQNVHSRHSILTVIFDSWKIFNLQKVFTFLCMQLLKEGNLLHLYKRNYGFTRQEKMIISLIDLQ